MKLFKTLGILFLIGLTLGVGTILLAYVGVKDTLPSVEILKDVRLQTPLRIYTADKKLIAEYGVKKRLPLALDEIPQDLVKAIIATEDSRFFLHEGIDPVGLVRAAFVLLLTGEMQQGGSTLTMQLARGFFLTRDKNILRKIREIFIAWHIEQVLSKEEILTLYLNKIALGHRAYGVGAAAQVYYGKPLGELNLAQLATIAGLPKAPSTMNPISAPQRSLERRKVVLGRMLAEGYISREQYLHAANAPVTASRHGTLKEFDAPYLADWVYTQMIELYGKEEAETGGYEVFTTVNSKLQAYAQQAVRNNIHDYDERHGYKGVLTNLEARWQVPNIESVPLDLTALETSAAAFTSTSELRLPNVNSLSVGAQLALPTPTSLALTRLTPAEKFALIADIPSYTPLHKGIVTKVMRQAVAVLLADGQEITINWPGLLWARPYLNDDRQGSPPQQASDILRDHDVIYVRQDEQGIWRLAQLPEVSGAFVALDPEDGAVEAIVGGYNFYQSQFNRVIQAKRQVGSNIKPFVYSAALAQGATVASVINDAPINQWDAESGIAWRPQNSPPVYDGPIRLRRALGKSKNVVSIRLLRQVGIEDTARHIARFGFNLDDIPRDETLALGSGSHTPMEVARGFATFANGGFLISPYVIAQITDTTGQILWQANPAKACDPCLADSDDIEAQLAAELGQTNQDIYAAPRVLSAEHAFLVKDMLATAVRANGNYSRGTYWLGTGWRARNLLQRTDIGGKTGTTNDARDAWFSGYAPGLVATSWLGFDNMARRLGRASRHQPLINMNPEKFNWFGNAMIGAEDGAKGAQPAWIRFMQQALNHVPKIDTPVPAGIVQVRIDRKTGKRTSRSDHTSKFEYFIRGTEPQSFITDKQTDEQALSGDELEIF